jgi:hypothetical protein
MHIEIFEIKGYEIDTELDMLILDVHKKNDGIQMKKIDVLDKNAIKKHKDIIDILKKGGLESLPIIKVDGKITTKEKFEKLMQRML